MCAPTSAASAPSGALCDLDPIPELDPGLRLLLPLMPIEATPAWHADVRLEVDLHKVSRVSQILTSEPGTKLPAQVVDAPSSFS